jgi:RND family efflux transporter MFP subunit
VKRRTRWILLVGGLVALVGAASGLLLHRKQQLRRAPRYGNNPTPVTVVLATQGALVRERPYLAVVRAANATQVSARVTAAVDHVLCDEGDKVQAGEPLVMLDGREVRHRLRALAAQIEQAQSDLAANEASTEAVDSSLEYWHKEAQRDRRLAREGAIPGSQSEKTADKAIELRRKLEAARAQSDGIRQRVAALRQQRKEVKAQLSYYTITSPYDAVVTRRLVDPGKMAAPGVPLLELEGGGNTKLVFKVPQDEAAEMATGLEVRFMVQGQEQDAELSLLYPSINEARMMEVEAWLTAQQAAGLLTGAYVPVTVVLERRPDVTLVPRSSVIRDPAGKPHVFVVDSGRLRARAVQLLGHSGDQAALARLRPGTKVVHNTFLGWVRLSSGEKVTAVQ